MLVREGEVLIGLDYEYAQLGDPAFRAAIKEVSHELEAAGLSQMDLLHFRSGAVMASVTLLGPYLVPVAQIVIPTLGAILVAWVKMSGRKVRVKVGDVLIEATSVEDVERLIPQLKELQGRARSKKPAA